uniref:Uncharacterized protein n=1 Tax=Sipha flava TaxID=143950 RepID=A0A2S2QPR6_9HEMI
MLRYEALQYAVLFPAQSPGDLDPKNKKLFQHDDVDSKLPTPAASFRVIGTRYIRVDAVRRVSRVYWFLGFFFRSFRPRSSYMSCTERYYDFRIAIIIISLSLRIIHVPPSTFTDKRRPPRCKMHTNVNGIMCVINRCPRAHNVRAYVDAHYARGKCSRSAIINRVNPTSRAVPLTCTRCIRAALVVLRARLNDAVLKKRITVQRCLPNVDAPGLSS